MKRVSQNLLRRKAYHPMGATVYPWKGLRKLPSKYANKLVVVHKIVGVVVLNLYVNKVTVHTRHRNARLHASRMSTALGVARITFVFKGHVKSLILEELVLDSVRLICIVRVVVEVSNVKKELALKGISPGDVLTFVLQILIAELVWENAFA